MKYINTILLLAIAAGLCYHSYYSHRHYLAIESRLDSLSIRTAVKDQEPGPFDKMPNNPMQDNHTIPVKGTTTISFDRTAHDFGKVESGSTYSTTFKFKNTGSEDLYISAATASCGCTVPKWSKDAIKPGDSGEISVEFDSKGRQGEQLKTVTVTTNTDPPQNVLTMKTFLYLRTK